MSLAMVAAVLAGCAATEPVGPPSRETVWAITAAFAVCMRFWISGELMKKGALFHHDGARYNIKVRRDPAKNLALCYDCAISRRGV